MAALILGTQRLVHFVGVSYFSSIFAIHFLA